jgi:hypothetical protein
MYAFSLGLDRLDSRFKPEFVNGFDDRADRELTRKFRYGYGGIMEAAGICQDNSGVSFQDGGVDWKAVHPKQSCQTLIAKPSTRLSCEIFQSKECELRT